MLSFRKVISLLIICIILFSLLVESAVYSEINILPFVSLDICKKINLLKGDSENGITESYLKSTPTRLQALMMYLRLKGLETEALNYKGSDNFSDASKVDWDGGKAVMAYIKVNGYKLGIEGVGDNKLDPVSPIDAASYYKVMLDSLGYKINQDYEYENVLEFAETKGLYLVSHSSRFTVKDIAIATVEALVSELKDSDLTLAEDLYNKGILKDLSLLKNALPEYYRKTIRKEQIVKFFNDNYKV